VLYGDGKLSFTTSMVFRAPAFGRIDKAKPSSDSGAWMRSFQAVVSGWPKHVADGLGLRRARGVVNERYASDRRLEVAKLKLESQRLGA
jgi:hypothetical protein